MKNLKLPVGIEDFQEILRNGFYYIDKTGLIEQLLDSWGKVNLFTRPCRFGKSLNMSMLRYFFEIGTDKTLFNGLHIMQRKDLCDEYMGRFPVVFLTLKGVDGLTFEKATNKLIKIVALEAERFIFLKNSDKLTDNEKQRYCALVKMQDGKYAMDEDTLESALQTLSELLYRHYGQKVVILVDEYDVPLQAAYQNNYYEEMVEFLRSVFSSALKTNDALEKGVMTGCLRISKESIFTGLNNFTAYSVLNNISSESFGFTELEVKQLLKAYNLSEKMDEVKEWYDGYQFGNKEIYNPWSTLMYVKNITQDVSFKPISFWANTSGNDIVVKYIQNGDKKLRKEFDVLMSGQSLIKYIKPELTYREMDNINNIYSFLLLTGYLKVIKDRGENQYELVIPNKEVYEIYKQSFMSYFEDYTTSRKGELYQEFVDGDAKKVNLLLNDILLRSISYFDNQESFYHGFLVGLLNDYEVVSNRESGNGRFDVCVLPENILGTVVLIECKHSISEDDLIDDAKEGARQIVEKKYLEEHRFKKYENAIGYGMSFYKKQCYVVKVEYDSKM